MSRRAASPSGMKSRGTSGFSDAGFGALDWQSSIEKSNATRPGQQAGRDVVSPSAAIDKAAEFPVHLSPVHLSEEEQPDVPCFRDSRVESWPAHR